MELIQTVTVGSGGAAAIEFGAGGTLPTTYDDLYLVVSGRSSRSAAGDSLLLTLNGSTANFAARWLEGDGANRSTGTQARLVGSLTAGTNTANTFSSVAVYFPNYRSSVAKSYTVDSVTENNATTAFQSLIAGLWSNTAAITTVRLTPDVGSFVEGSSASLYGIRKFTGDSTPKATGGTVSQAGGYWIHTFTTSGDFIPSQALTNVEYLVIAGGGGGGASGGGGGAGGYRNSVVGETSGANSSAESRLSLASGTRYNVMVGAGGIGGDISSAPRGGSGTSSSFAGISSTGGGGGGGSNGVGLNLVNGNAGGSGGGGAEYFGAGTGGAGTANQGLAGGTGATGSGAGGGGATQVGGNIVTPGTGGLGGNGLSSSITGTAVTRAGGGGGGDNNATGIGGTGGNGGGGSGGFRPGSGSWSDGGNATQSTGSGGGGGGNIRIGGNGGSGIVIVRYAV